MQIRHVAKPYRSKEVTHWYWLVLLMLLLVAALAETTHAETPKPALFVFIQTDTKPRALEKTLESHMPDVDVTVFGRYRDFEKALRSGMPDAVIALEPVLKARALAPTLQGLRGKRASQNYALISVGIVDVASLADKKVGSVDLVGRKKMKSFVGNLLGMTNPISVVTVTKTEDLLPLLQFRSADAVILPESAFAAFKGRTQLDLRKQRLANGEVGLPALAIGSDRGRKEILPKIQKLSSRVNQKLGVEKWAALK